ncbi:MAG: hypothetical protein M1830_008546 [Pleopsidium flavum]|nr:MAG: hypothetical protein M1830_008546 [Pleopsidium flavum]
MPTKGSFPGGYSEAEIKKLEKITLPEKIRCKQCKKYKIQGGFSKKQLSELQKRIARFGNVNSSTGAYISCRQCVGQQVEELTCCICDEVKGLNGFSKVQRRNPDNARCLRCVTLHVNTEPGVNVDDEEDEDSDDISNPYESDHEDEYASDSGVPVGNFAKFGLTERNLKSGQENTMPYVKQKSTKSDFSEDGGVIVSEKSKENMRTNSAGGSANIRDGSVWLEQGRRGRSNFTGVGIPFTGYDSQGLSHARFRAPSTAASEQSWGAAASTGSSLRSSKLGFSKSGFAKVRGSGESRSSMPKPSILNDEPTASKGKHRAMVKVPDFEQEDDDDEDEGGIVMEW